MKRFRYVVLTILLAGSAAALSAQQRTFGLSPSVAEIERVMIEWQNAMRVTDADRLASLYLDEAVRIFAFTTGGRDVIEGRRRIRLQQEAAFRQIQRDEPDALRGFTLPEPEILTLPDRLPMMVYSDPAGMSVNIFHFEERDGRFLISRHAEIVNELEPVEAPAGRGWADADGNGILDPEEQLLAIAQYQRLTSGPHDVEGFIDDWFDWDANGFVDPDEAERAWTIVYRDGLRQGYRYFPEFAERYVDVDRSGSVSIHEAERILFLGFGRELEVPRPISNELDEMMDVDLDGWVIAAEEAVLRRAITRAVAAVPEHTAMNPRMSADVRWARWWADKNEDGILDVSEIADIGIILFRLINSTRLVATPIELLYDSDRDFMISEEERASAMAELAQYLPAGERDLIARFARSPEQLFNIRVTTGLHREMDTDPRNGRLSEAEVRGFLENRFLPIAERWVARAGSDLIGGDRVEYPAVGPADSKADPDAVELQTPTPVPTGPAVTADQTGDDVSLDVRLNPVYPVLRKHYDTSPVGTVTISNVGDTEMSDIEASLSMSRFVDQPRVYDEIESLGVGESIDIPLTVLFNSTVLEITEGERVDATITVEFTTPAGASEETVTETMIFYDRNAIRWDDTRKVAAFVTERDEEIRSYARRVIAGSRDERNEAVDGALQDAMAIFIAMVESDLMYFRDPTSSYASASSSGSTIDYMQFPRQTLTDYGGDCDDLSVCFNALLESVGRRTAFITVPGHILPAVALQMTADEARSAFLDPTDLVFGEDNTVWVPVEITALEDSFYEAWQTGARTYRQYSGSGQAEVIPTASAWSVYESVASVVDDEVDQPDRDEVAAELADALAEFVNTQIASRELQLKADLADRPGDRRLLNRLGVLYAQYGIWDKAEEQFKAIVETEEYIPALINLGHIAFLDGEYRDAAAYYDQVLELQSSNPGALLASARAHHELENYGNVRTHYEQLRSISPRLAADYSYLDLSSSNDSARAQAATEFRSRVIWEREDEEAAQ